MCDFSGRLVAWMDRELPDNEAADAEQHVRECSECRRRVDGYKQVSRAFVAHCDAVMEGTTRRRPRWVPVLASADSSVGHAVPWCSSQHPSNKFLGARQWRMPPRPSSWKLRQSRPRRVASTTWDCAPRRLQTRIGRYLKPRSRSPFQSEANFSSRCCPQGDHIHRGRQYGSRRIGSRTPSEAK